MNEVIGEITLPVSPTFTCLDVRTCARCGNDHERLAFAPFTNPVNADGDTELFASHWATCPVTREPLLMIWYAS